MEGAFRQEACAVFYTFFVEGDFWMMQEVAFVLFCFCTEEIELAGDGAGIEGEVLPYQIG